jgi:hypothetical protein
LLRAFLLAALLAVAGCQIDEPTLGGTVLSVIEAERGEDFDYREPSAKEYEDMSMPEVAWQLEVRLDDGAEVTVTHQGPRRYEPGERVRLLLDSDGRLLL